MIMAGMGSRLRTALDSFRRCERGNFLMLFGLALIPLVLAIGVGVDLGRAYVVQSRLTSALDAAALAAATAPNPDRLAGAAEQNLIRDFATRVFWANYRTDFWGGGLDSSGLQFAFGAFNSTIDVSARAQMPTAIMALAGQNTVNVSASSQARRETTGLELALVLDVTGSMRSGNNYVALRNAATSLVNIVYGEGPSGYNNTGSNLFVALVPYAATVNINRARLETSHSATSSGRVRPQPSVANTASTNPRTGFPLYNASRIDWIRTADRPSIDPDGTYPPADPGHEIWSGCIEERRTTPTDYFGPNYTPSITITANAGQTFQIRYDNLQDTTYNARSDAHDLTDAPPSADAQRFRPYIYPWNAIDNRYVAADGSDPTYYLHADARPSGPPAPEGYTFSGTGANENHQRGPNLGCPNLSVIPLVSDRRQIVNAITNIQPWHRGGTMTNVGLAWGWRVLSPNWPHSAYWPEGAQSWTYSGSTYSLPLAYATARQFNMRKVIVIMTDGENQAYDYIGLQLDTDALSLGNDYGAYGRPDSTDSGFSWGATRNNLGVVMRTGSGSNGWEQTRNEARVVLDRRTAELCTRIKDEGVMIYTITFGDVDQQGRGLFYQCATRNLDGERLYFHAPNQAALQDVFEQIGDQLSNLRISR